MIKVWDLFVRLSHWLVVLLILSAWLSAHFGDAEFKWHSFNGYAVFVVVLSRIIWGFIGSTTARFSNFIKAPWKVPAYLLDLLRGKAPSFLGHNPAGGWMVLAFWLVLLSQTIAGMFSSDDVLAEGPFTYAASESTVNFMTSWHHRLFDLLIILIILHVLAVIYHQWIKREKLLQAMFTGEKPLPPTENTQGAKLIFRPIYLAFILMGIITLLLGYIVNSYT